MASPPITTPGNLFQVPNALDGPVLSFNARTGNVTPQAGDYTAAQVGAATPAEVATAQAAADAAQGDATTALANAATAQGTANAAGAVAVAAQGDATTALANAATAQGTANAAGAAAAAAQGDATTALANAATAQGTANAAVAATSALPTQTAQLNMGNFPIVAQKTSSFNGIIVNGPGSAGTIAFGDGQKQRLTLDGNGSWALTFPAGVGNYQMEVIQDGTGGWVPAFTVAGGVVIFLNGALGLPIAANSKSLAFVYYNGVDVWMSVIGPFS